MLLKRLPYLLALERTSPSVSPSTKIRLLLTRTLRRNPKLALVEAYAELWNLLALIAGATRLELATSGGTGRSTTGLNQRLAGTR
jgi:hypothetical protein